MDFGTQTCCNWLGGQVGGTARKRPLARHEHTESGCALAEAFKSPGNIFPYLHYGWKEVAMCKIRHKAGLVSTCGE